MEWLGVLWAWIVDPVGMADAREERLRAARGVHVTRMTRHGVKCVMTCSCGWQRIAFLAQEKTSQARAMCDAHEDRFRDAAVRSAP